MTAQGETLSLMAVAIPIIVPLIIEPGYDAIWFGILAIVLIEMALIAPPAGLNPCGVQGAWKSEVMIGTIPFVLTARLMVAALIAMSEIAVFVASLL